MAVRRWGLVRLGVLARLVDVVRSLVLAMTHIRRRRYGSRILLYRGNWSGMC